MEDLEHCLEEESFEGMGDEEGEPLEGGYLHRGEEGKGSTLPKELLVPNEGETTLMPLGIFMGEEQTF